MKEINIAKTLIKMRREKGITQDDLANYIGVSKASVSKWETGQSYPDITFLPQLAAYFNISIDELMDYSPQMVKEDIKKLYHELALRFANEAFEDVLAQCRSLIKKYYSCFPLLMQMAILLINHHMLAKSDEEKQAILRDVIELCIRIKTESGDVRLSKEAVYMQATCCLALREPQSALDLLGEETRPPMAEEILISQAYQMMGNIEKAKEAVQLNMYGYLMSLSSAMLHYLPLCAGDMDKAKETINRALSLADIYKLKNLNPNMVIQLYAVGAQIYCQNGFSEKAIDMLDKSVDVFIENLFPCTLHGDSFFDSIDGWLSDLDLGDTAPRSEKVIKESMMQDVLMNPAFAKLSEEPKYKSIIRKSRDFTGGN